MSAWWRKGKEPAAAAPAETRVREKYGSFKELLTLNNDCLELLAGLQEDLRYAPPRADVLGDRVPAVFDKAEGAVAALERLEGERQPVLWKALASQRRDVEGSVAARQALVSPRLSVWLHEIGAEAAPEAGGKAAALGEVKNRLGLPVPEGFVITTESYWRFCGVPLWKHIRDTVEGLDLDELQGFQEASARLSALVMAADLPRAVEVAVSERAAALETGGLGLAVRSSAVGEGGTGTFAGQFLSLINVAPAGVTEAYKRVVASRFSARALSYRVSTGRMEVDSPMAVLFMPTLRARASGIMYTRDPGDPGKDSAWIAATRGLALDVASGQTAADLFVVSRRGGHTVMERRIARKEGRLLPMPGGGLTREQASPDEASAPSLQTEDLQVLAEWAVHLEAHFNAPQDVEWLLDEEGNLWIVQTRPLSLADPKARQKVRTRGAPLLAGGQTVYPGRASGRAFLVEDVQDLSKTPQGALLVMRRPSPEIVKVFPRIVGLVAEGGNVTGHGAALLREFKVPSVFQMKDVFDTIKPDDAVSLDAVQPRLYEGLRWPRKEGEVALPDRYARRDADPISGRFLTLHLVDPAAFSFRPSGCKSAHDVLRYCHEKAIEAMFAVNDVELERGPRCAKRLVAPIPVNLHVLDLGGGLVMDDPSSTDVRPEHIVSRPFQALWRGASHPGVSWNRDMAASLAGIASVMASSFSSHSAQRPLGDKSYLLVADEYMNLNSRLAYHYSLVDACVSAVPNNNYISFRFAGGGASRSRRILRACFIEACLCHYGFQAERRGDIVNAWFKKGSAQETEAKLDIVGRLLASAGQLDMYMGGEHAMKWYVKQFVEGNYGFLAEGAEGAAVTTQPRPAPRRT